MNGELKNALKQSFAAPEPAGKEEFFQRMPPAPVSISQFICTQAAYIRKGVWALSALVFGAALAGARGMALETVWGASALMPLLALTVLTESGRSETWGMAELELSTRFSLKSVVLARMGILGAVNLALFLLLLPVAGKNSGAGLFRTGVYLACPYLLTAFCGLWVVRRVRGREAAFFCCGLAAAVSAGNLLLPQAVPAAYGERGFLLWLAALAVLGAGTIRQSCEMIRQTEELLWN